MLTRITAFTLLSAYPDNVLIDTVADPETGKHAAFCHLLRDGAIHRLLVSTTPVFADKAAALTFFSDLVSELKTSKEL